VQKRRSVQQFTMSICLQNYFTSCSIVAAPAKSFNTYRSILLADKLSAKIGHLIAAENLSFCLPLIYIVPKSCGQQLKAR
jgi:hypothetical protein